MDSSEEALPAAPSVPAAQADNIEAATTATAAAVASSINQSGIDIQRALDILSTRSTCSGNDDHHSPTNGCHHHHANDPNQAATPEELKSMGQIIDLFEDKDQSNNGSDNDITEPEKSAKAEVAKQEQEKQRQVRMEQMMAKLESMTIKELLQTVMQTQQQRVEVYHGYNK